MSAKKLYDIIAQGYSAALTHAFSGAALYAQGFIDGMKYQKDGTIPMTALDKEIARLKNKE